MSVSMEQQYRQALRWYPKTWRTVHGAVLLGILMDAAEERGDIVAERRALSDLRSSGLQARFGFLGRVVTPNIRDRVSAIALGIGVAFSIWAAMSSVSNATGQANFASQFGLRETTTFGPFLSPGVIHYATWIAAFVTALIGRPRATRIILIATLPIAILSRVLSEHLGMTSYISTTTVVMLETFAFLASFSPTSIRVRWRTWLLLSLLVTIGWLTWVETSTHQALPFIPSFGPFERYFFFFTQPYIAWVCSIGAGLVLVCVVIRHWTWAVVVAILLVPWLALYAVSSNHQGYLGGFAVWVVIGAGVIGVAAALSAKSRYRIQITRK